MSLTDFNVFIWVMSFSDVLSEVQLGLYILAAYTAVVFNQYGALLIEMQ